MAVMGQFVNIRHLVYISWRRLDAHRVRLLVGLRMEAFDMSRKLWPAPSQSDWPLYGLIDDVRPSIKAMFEAGESGALVTLVGADGPSPRPIGSQMLITKSGLAGGYVSGGCVEASLELIAHDVLAIGQARRIRFGGDSPYLDVQLVCGTSIELVIEPIVAGDTVWTAVLAACVARQPITRILGRDGKSALTQASLNSALVTLGQGDTAYSRLYPPNQRLVVIGSDPVALATISLAHTIGIEAHLMRYLGPVSPPDLPHEQYQRTASFDELDNEYLDAYTALVTTTHDLELDHPILRRALASRAFYVGALGSKRKREERLARLLADGSTPAQTDKLHAPVGLAIGAATPYEIAISILADIIAQRRQSGLAA
jgi:xanthine dehydrogenase accessory factor